MALMALVARVASSTRSLAIITRLRMFAAPHRSRDGADRVDAFRAIARPVGCFEHALSEARARVLAPEHGPNIGPRLAEALHPGAQHKSPEQEHRQARWIVGLATGITTCAQEVAQRLGDVGGPHAGGLKAM
jgi:hypothetical protein